MKNSIIIFLICFVSFTGELSVSAQQALFPGPLGVQTYTFRRGSPENIALMLDTIKLLGFTEIEGSGGRMPPEEFKKLCDERGLTIPSTGAGYEQLTKKADSVIYRAKALGSKFVMCAWIPHPRDSFNITHAKKAVEDFNKAGQSLKEAGLTLCYHAHGYEFQPYGTGTLLDYIIENTNPDFVSFEMDIFWIQFGGGDPAALLTKYGNRWKLMHLKDIRKGTKKDLSGGTSVENDVTLGTGELDLPAILKTARKAGVRHYFIEDESSNYITQVAQSIAYLRSLKE